VKIPLGQAGLAVPEPVAGPRAIPGAFVQGHGNLGAHVQNAAAQLQDVALQASERDAIVEATTGTLAAKTRVDEWRVAQAQSPVDENGNPKHETALKDFDSFGEKIQQEALKTAKTPLAKKVIQKDLGTYLQSTRRQVLEVAEKQKKDFQSAAILSQIEAVKVDATIPAEERDKRLGQLLGAAVQTGTMTLEEATKAKAGFAREAAFGQKWTAVNSAVTKEQLYELRGQFSQYDATLGPELSSKLYNLVNERLTQVDRQSESALKAQAEDAQKAMIDKFASGTLTKADVEAARSKLTASDYERWSKAPGVQQKADAEGGIDDGPLYREVQRDVLNAYRDAKKLESLRAHVTDLMTGYSKQTKTTGKPALTRATGKQLIDDIDQALGSLRSEGRQNKSDLDQTKTREFNDAEAKLKGYFEAASAGKTRREQGEMEQRLNNARLQLLDNRQNAGAWMEKFRKDNPDLFEKRGVSFPSWATPHVKGGKLDAQAAKDAATAEFKKKAMNQKAYQDRLNEIDRLSRD